MTQDLYPFPSSRVPRGREEPSTKVGGFFTLCKTSRVPHLARFRGNFILLLSTGPEGALSIQTRPVGLELCLLVNGSLRPYFPLTPTIPRPLYPFSF